MEERVGDRGSVAWLWHLASKVHASEELTQRWQLLIKELRTTDKPQTEGRLQRSEFLWTGQAGFCCLGIICEVALEHWRELQGDRRYSGTGSWSYAFYYLNEDRAADFSATSLPAPLKNYLGLYASSLDALVPVEVQLWATQDESASADVLCKRRGFFPGETVVPTTALELNDNFLFPFAKIADCLEYTYVPRDWAAGVRHGGGSEPSDG